MLHIHIFLGKEDHKDRSSYVQVNLVLQFYLSDFKIISPVTGLITYIQYLFTFTASNSAT